MSRSLVLGNGTILACFDSHGQVRDFYFPHVGLENHIGSGDVHKLGVWVEGRFSWLSDPGWNIILQYEKESLVGRVAASHDGFELELVFSDVVYNEKNIFIRKVSVANRSSRRRTIKVFFNQQFQISQTNHADTAYYNPSVEALIHYKGRRVFLVSGMVGQERLSDYSVGIFKIEGKEGTWKDAEDGILSQNAIEHGSVDSTLALTFEIEGGGGREGHYWITVAETFSEAVELQEYLLEKSPDHLVSTARDFWRAWVNKFNFSFHGLSEDVVTLFKKSLLVIRTHADNHGGILASGDSDNFRYGRDTYAYVWPRDGAFVAMALDRSGYFDIAHRFYEFANEVITSDGYVLHKYQADKSLGSSWHPWVREGKHQLPIQEDETALLLVGLWIHYEKSRDLEFIERIYNNLIKRAAYFLLAYRGDVHSALPSESYDLWEEKRGVSTFTASASYGALLAASRFAALLGKREEEDRFLDAAEDMKKAILDILWNEEGGFFYKLVRKEGARLIHDTTVDSSSLFGIVHFGVLPFDDARVKKARETMREKLFQSIPIGGFARYEGDVYYGVTSDVPGNPWFITTLWQAHHAIALAQTEDDMEDVRKTLEWVCAHAHGAGMLAEQLHPLSGFDLSVSPLTWSHAEFVATVIAYLEKLEELGICVACYPVK